MSAPDNNSFSLPPLRWGLAGLRSEAAPKLRWLWHGYLAVGAVTLLTSQWKIGKTTLLSILLARMKAGGTLAGLPVKAGRAVVISEESSEQWLLRSRRLDLDGHIGWYCRPFRGRPSPQQWQDLLDCVAEAAAERDVSLAVIDPLASFFPGQKRERRRGHARRPGPCATAGGARPIGSDPAPSRQERQRRRPLRSRQRRSARLCRHPPRNALGREKGDSIDSLSKGSQMSLSLFRLLAISSSLPASLALMKPHPPGRLILRVCVYGPKPAGEPQEALLTVTHLSNRPASCHNSNGRRSLQHGR
jgi:hypothetical protein